MTSSTLFETVFAYTVNVEDLASAAVETPAFQLSNVNWKIKFEKKSEFVSVYLVGELDDAIKEWSCEAKAKLTLLHKDSRSDTSVVKYLPNRKFGHKNLTHGIDNFIEWNEFSTDYVSDNGAKFEFKISTNPRKVTTPSTIDQSYVRFSLLIEHVSELQVSDSPEIVIRGIKWKIRCGRCYDYFSIHLCTTQEDMEVHWSYNVHVTFSLLSHRDDVTPVTKSTSKSFRCGSLDQWGYKEFISWTDFISDSKKYVSEDCAMLEIDIGVDEPKPRWQISRSVLSTAYSLLQCCVCYTCFSSGNIFSTRCGHLFCQYCCTKSIGKNPVCPMCQTASSLDEVHPIYFS